MTNVQRNIETTRAIYDRFGRGDVPGILSCLAEDVDWEYGASDHGIPWLQHRQGRAGAGQFFESLGGMEIHSFRVFSVSGDGEYVVALIAIEFTVKKTGKQVKDESEAHIWRFRPDGLVSSFRHVVDTYQQHQALQPSAR